MKNKKFTEKRLIFRRRQERFLLIDEARARPTVDDDIWSTETQNRLAKDKQREIETKKEVVQKNEKEAIHHKTKTKLNEVRKELGFVHKVRGGDTLGAIVLSCKREYGLQGNIWSLGLDAVLRKGGREKERHSLSSDRWAKVLRPGQYVWMEEQESGDYLVVISDREPEGTIITVETETTYSEPESYASTVHYSDDYDDQYEQTA